MSSVFKWEKLYNGLVYVMTSGGCSSSPKIAAFDMDWTLIGTQSGNVFPKDSKDWRFLYNTKTVDKIKSLHQDGFKVVVISNQSRLTSDAAVQAFKAGLFFPLFPALPMAVFLTKKQQNSSSKKLKNSKTQANICFKTQIDAFISQKNS